ncbi:protein MODIFIER OF SNC1 11 isoform X1 [Canna indica]|uniref:Protein MODIFIER OF SNC1 11 isoform X1 n=1 Tax=Canna indica TaxID=4628 RepID=A0AAQ3KJV9_9LILI|nr:protein MODIFIER OF SNC1 11 isoform X1 [Canna indica]
MASQNPTSSTEPGKKAMDAPPSEAEASIKPAPSSARLQNPTSAPSAPTNLETLANADDSKKDGRAGAGEEQTAAKRVEASVSGGSNSVVASAPEAAPITDLERKHRRAERFGMPVMLSEEEKRNSRAERFGTGSTLNGNNNVGQLEEQKRKARAERFGLKVDTAADEEAKKKARSERFAPNSKLDTSEEEKMKARAIRFSQASSEVSSQANSNLKATTIADT